MKYIILFALLAPSFAPAATLGIPDGICRGKGTLISGFPLPDLEFESVRVLKNGRVDATSVVTILGFRNEVTAHLGFSPDPAGLAVLDLSKPSGKSFALAGRALCGPSECAFDAKVLNGDLYLKETWIRNNTGFSVRSGYEIFKGIESRYEAEFQCDFN